MFEQIRRLGTETAIYGISTIVGRFLNFLLVPFYTNILAPGDYGIVAYVYSLLAFMNVLYSYGMESAYLRYASTKEIGTGEQNFSTPFLSLFLSSSVFSLALVGAAPLIGSGIELPREHLTVVSFSAWILLFDALAIIPFASLRLEGKAKTFAALKVINIVINVGCNVVFLVIFRMGIEGIFLSGFIASASTFLMLVPLVVRQFTRDFSPVLYRSLLRFGLPYIPAGLAAMMIQVVDRPILRMLTDDASVGIYQANYRLGIFMMLIVAMFDYAWRPFFLTHAKEPKAKELFARVLTYFVVFVSLLFLLLTFFLPDIVALRLFGRHLIHPDYWSALGIVPIVMLGYIFLGVYNNLIAGIHIEKKTQYVPAITFAGAAVNVAANLILIPILGLFGAAWATFLSYFVMAMVLYVVVQRIYPVHYEWTRLAKIAAAAGLSVALYYAVPMNTWTFLWKVGLLILFCVALYLLRFFDAGELSRLRKLLPPFVP